MTNFIWREFAKIVMIKISTSFLVLLQTSQTWLSCRLDESWSEEIKGQFVRSFQPVKAMPSNPDLKEFIGDAIKEFGGHRDLKLRQAIKDLVIEPAPNSVTVRFRTVFSTTAIISIYRVISGSFDSDRNTPGSFAALRFSSGGSLNGTTRHTQYIDTAGINKFDQNTKYWVRIECRDENLWGELPGSVIVTKQFRTWKRTAQFDLSKIFIVEDSDTGLKGPKGELSFTLLLWNVKTKQIITDELNAATNRHPQREFSPYGLFSPEFSIASPNWIYNPFSLFRFLPTVATFAAAPDQLGIKLRGYDDDADWWDGANYTAADLTVPPIPEGPYQQANSNQRIDNAEVYDIFTLPNDPGGYEWTMQLKADLGKLKFNGYYTIKVEVTPTSQPLNWGWYFDPDNFRETVIDIGSNPELVYVGDGSKREHRVARSAQIFHAENGELILLTNDNDELADLHREAGSFQQVNVIRSLRDKQSLTLVASDSKHGLRFANVGLGETSKLSWHKFEQVIRGKFTVSTNQGKTWSAFAISEKGEPLQIDANGKSKVIGPVTKREPKLIFAKETKRGWSIVLLDKNGEYHAVADASSKRAEWVKLPAELGDVFAIIPLPDGSVAFFGLDAKRTLQGWSPAHKTVQSFDTFEELIPDEPESPEYAALIKKSSKTSR